MKKLHPFFCSALLLFLFPTFTASSATAPLPDSNRALYVSLVEENKVHRYLNRFATPKAHIVVTLEPVKAAMQSKALTFARDRTLLLVELQNKNQEPLPGERLRFSNVAVVDAPAGSNPEDYATDTRYAEAIAASETEVTPWPGTTQPQFATETSPSKLTIDQNFLEAKLNAFSGAQAAIINGKSVTISERSSKQGKDNARAYLKQEYEALGFKTSLQDYGNIFSPGVNFIAEKIGRDPSKVVILASHMDTVNTAGADDNGSGTISALAIAAALKDKELRYTLRIVAFDQEEKGLLGSIAYAKALNKDGSIKQILGLIDFEMTGYDADDDGALHIIDCNENSSANLTAGITRVIDRDSLRLSKVDACTNRSDHASFWKYNVPAVVISQNFFGGDGNPCYHKSCDTVDRLHFDYMTRLTTAVGRAVEELVASDGSL